MGLLDKCNIRRCMMALVGCDLSSMLLWEKPISATLFLSIFQGR
jgi:hypothetical protein